MPEKRKGGKKKMAVGAKRKAGVKGRPHPGGSGMSRPHGGPPPKGRPHGGRGKSQAGK